MIIAVLGWIGSGKDTVSNYLVSNHGFVKESFASTLKDTCASIFGWSREMLSGETSESREWREEVDVWWERELGLSGFTPRYALQNIGTNVFRDHFHKDIWLLSLKRRLMLSENENMIISDCRFINEIDFLKSLGGKLIVVDHGFRPEWYSTALLALRGDLDAKFEMENKYAHVHRSEWDWLAVVPDAVIMNDYQERNEISYKDLLKRIDHTIETLSR